MCKSGHSAVHLKLAGLYVNYISVKLKENKIVKGKRSKTKQEKSEKLSQPEATYELNVMWHPQWGPEQKNVESEEI